MVISLLARILIWFLIGRLLWFLLVKLIPKTYLTWFGGVIPLLLLVLIVAKPESSGLQVAWQILSLPLTPLGLSLLLLALAFKEGQKKIKARQVMTATLILFFSSLPVVAFSLVDNLEGAVFKANTQRLELCRNGPEVCPVDPQSSADEAVGAIVVFNEGKTHYWLGSPPIAALSQLPSDTIVMSQVSSTLLGAQLYSDRVRQNGNQPLVIVTGGSPEADRSEAERQEHDFIINLLMSRGVDPGQVRLLSTGFAVRATVNRVTSLLSTQVADENLRQRVAIVAPALLLRRISLAFSRTGLRVVAYASESYQLNAPPRSGLLEDVASLLPNVYALELTSRAVAEYWTTIYYFLRDWLPSFNVLSEGAIDVGGTRRF